MQVACRYTMTSTSIILHFPEEFDSSMLAAGSVGDSHLDRTTDPIIIVQNDIGPGEVITTHLADALITTAKLANLSVDDTKLAALSVVAGKIASNAVDSAELVDGAVTTTKIANLAVGTAAIAAAAISTAKIADLAVTDAKIDTLGVNKLAAGTITSKLLTLAITAAGGDVGILCGKTNFGDTTAGFIFGIDDSDSDKVKVEIGDSTYWMRWRDSLIVNANVNVSNSLNLLNKYYSSFETITSTDELGTKVNGTWTIDGTQYYAGVKSLKCAATAADAYCYLGDNSFDYNIQLDPSQQYLLSGYVKTDSTTSINGQLYLRTNASGNHYTFTSFSVINTDGWKRVYGLVTIDASTRGIMRVDNDGGSGKNMWFDGLQIERYTGTSSTPTPSDYSTTTLTRIDGDSIEVVNLTADNINTGMLYSRNYMTSGSYAPSAISASASTLDLYDASDFASSGSGWVLGTTNDRDAFSWTGKTGNQLTGCSGLLANAAGALVVPGNQQVYLVSADIGESRLYANRGDGTYEELANIGITQSGSDYIVGSFGSLNSGNSRIGLAGHSYSYYGMWAKSVTYGAFVAETAAASPNAAVYGAASSSGRGGYFTSSSGYGILCSSSSGYGGLFGGGSSAAPIVLVASGSASAPTHTATKGALWVTSAGILYINTDGSTTWGKVGAQ